MFWPLDCLYMLNRGWTLYKRWVTKSWLSTRSQFHSTNFFLSLNLWCKDLVPQKRRKGSAMSVLNFFGHWTVFMRWTESGLCTRHGGLRADALRSQTHCHPTNLFLSLLLRCKDLVPKKRGKGKAVSVECLGHWTVLMRWTVNGLCKRVMGDFRADPQRSQFHLTNLFLSLNLWCKDLVPQKRGKVNAVSVLNVLATGLS